MKIVIPLPAASHSHHFNFSRLNSSIIGPIANRMGEGISAPSGVKYNSITQDVAIEGEHKWNAPKV
jgi:hypothetical protein